MAGERTTEDKHDLLMGLLSAEKSRREVWFAGKARKLVHQIYDHTDAKLAAD